MSKFCQFLTELSARNTIVGVLSFHVFIDMEEMKLYEGLNRNAMKRFLLHRYE